jgi:hypothetical protein
MENAMLMTHKVTGEVRDQTPEATREPIPNGASSHWPPIAINWVEKTSLDDVRESVHVDDKGKWDLVLPRHETRLENGKLIFPDCRAYECESGLRLSNWAMGQICTRLNIPASYFKRCPAELQDTQYNWWNSERRNNPELMEDEDDFLGSEAENLTTAFENGFAHEPVPYQNGFSSNGNGHAFRNGLYTGQDKAERWLLRAKQDSLRAVLTERYSPLDNRTLLECLRKSLPPRLKVQWLSLDEESFHLRLFDPTLFCEVRSGDPLMAGLHIANSEVGKRSVTVDAIVYRQVCTNGLVKLVKGKSLMQQRHIAVAPAHFVTLLRHALEQALTVSHDFLERMVWSSQQPIRDVETEMKSLASHWHLSQGFVEQVQSHLQNEEAHHQENLFGLVNAVTRAAQTLDADRRYEMEVLAGKLLERKSTPSPVVRNGSGKGARLATLPHPAVDTARDIFGAESINGGANEDKEVL